MIIQPAQGNLLHQDFFIYGACDERYFDEFGKPLVNSIIKNFQNKIHLHLFNPRADQLEFLTANGVSFTYEYTPIDLFKNAAARWKTVPDNPIEKNRYDRILNAMSKSDDKDILDRIQRTYFACARFIRLQELLASPVPFFSIDVDAVVRKSIPILPTNKDFYIHHITGKKARFLAGGIMSSGNQQSHQFLKEYADVLKNSIERDYIYWGLDQDVLDSIVPKYNFGILPMSYIDWNMSDTSFIWTAKGARKDLEIFKNEKTKYSF